MRDRMVMVIGEFGFSSTTIQTWEFDGANWLLRTTGGPQRRTDFGMAYDPVRSRTLLFGGQPASGNDLNDTWEWDGSSCMQCPPPMVPSGRRSPTMAFDPSRGTLVLYGGFASSQALDDIWEWNGTQWSTCVARGALPPGRYSAAMVYDAAAGHLVMCGGHGP